MLSIERINRSDTFYSMSDEWNALLERSDSKCVFLTHEWLSTWWRHLADERVLHILTVRDGDRLLGILPLAQRAPQYARMMPRTLEFLGSGVIGSDYLDVIVDRDAGSEVLDVFAHHLMTTGLMIQFGQLRRGESVAGRLAERLEHRSWTMSDLRINVCPYVALSGQTWQTYLATLGSSQRYNFQRRVRNLEKTEGFRLEQARTSQEAQSSLDGLIELHKKRWNDKKEMSEAFQTPESVAFHHEFVQLALQKDWLRLLSIRIKDQMAAALYGLRFGSTFYFYQSGFEPEFSKQSVGLVMMGLAIKTAVDEGADEYDLLHGDEQYKMLWTPNERELGRIELFPPHVRGTLYRRCVTLNRAARRIVRKMLSPSA